jgi:uncharacterized protein YecT (DUF1311 family)
MRFPRLTPALPAILFAMAAATVMAGDALDGLSGTWGLPPVDGTLGVTGSYFTIARNAEGGIRAKISLNPSGWHCSTDSDVTWDAAAARYEWPNRSDTNKEQPCWLQLAPQKDRLDVTVHCPYECTDGEQTHAITLEHMSPDRLVSPDHVLDMFCATHDTLRQELCRPGEIQKVIAEGNAAGRQLGVLAEGNDGTPLLPETTAELLAILPKCRTAAAARACLLEAVRARRDANVAAVAARQMLLTEERKQSEAAAVPITAPAAWTGARYLVTDTIVASLTIDDCDAQHCDVSLLGDTNYTFGYQHHHGQCFHEHNALTLTAPDRGFSYVEPDDHDRNAEGAGPFANFCRFDLTRSGDVIHLQLRGMGCMVGCFSAQWPALIGDYHPRSKPSFTCREENWPDPWDEQNICLDPELAALDREMAAAFAKAKAGTSGPAQAALVKAQRAWIARRRDDCDQAKRRTCLVEAYRTRLQELTRP